MSHESLFLRAILDNPHDDVPRLQYADWLDEQGDPRGEFIRLQVELSRHDLDGSRRAALEERQQILLGEIDFTPEFSPATRWTNAIGMAFVLVPKGTFWMGGGGGVPGDQEVEIPHLFYMSAYPCTQAQWHRVMGSNLSYFSRLGRGQQKVKQITEAEMTQFPVECVSLEEIQTFVQRLNEQDSKTGWVYRLPTEAEWEYVCRGGASSQEECSFCYYFERPTNDLSSRQANFNGNYPNGGADMGPFLMRPTKVGSYPPNRLGVYDLHGNVWELCLNPEEVGSDRLAYRGGGWGSLGWNCRAANRHPYWSRHRNKGFRLARILHTASPVRKANKQTRRRGG